jgi:sugar phosphate isomerase/epimerase
MNRRDFVQQSTFTGTLMLLDPMSLLSAKAKRIGVQLWSVRDVVEKNTRRTLELIRKMGYPEIEGYKYDNGMFFNLSPSDYKQMLIDLDLKMTSSHTGFSMKHWDVKEGKLNDLAKKTIDDHAAVGVEQLICPGIDKELRTTESIKSLCEVFNHVGEACRKSGLQFGYHNHDYEFYPLEGRYMIDLILGQTDPALMVWEMDLYWVTFANEDPIRWIQQYGKRIHAFHVKDMAKTAKRESIEVGDGTIDFESIFKDPGAAKVLYYIVELEDYKTSSMEGINISLQHLKKILGTT